jgi:uncharacterized protein YraI
MDEMKAKIVAATLGIGMLVGSLVGATSAGAAPQGGARSASTRHAAGPFTEKLTTSRLNLRSGPGTDYDVILVMPEGADLWAADDEAPELHQNGFVKVTYDDTDGWASEEYLADAGAGGGAWGGGEGYDIIGTGVTTSRVNFRLGPGLNYAVQSVIDEGEQVAITGIVESGFRYVWYAGVAGWVSDDFITTDDGTRPASLPDAPTTGTATTTDNVNLRGGPSTDDNVHMVVPAGTEVETTEFVENGFRYVSVDGTRGWIYDDYLA